jgi:hypothetical protein
MNVYLSTIGKGIKQHKCCEITPANSGGGIVQPSINPRILFLSLKKKDL